MRTYLFASKTRPNAEPYRTTLHDNGEATCTCPARVKCWHRKDVEARPITGRTEYTGVRTDDRLAILRLMDEGNEAGAIAMALDLFPSMCLEETQQLIEEIRAYENVLRASDSSFE